MKILSVHDVAPNQGHECQKHDRIWVAIKLTLGANVTDPAFQWHDTCNITGSYFHICKSPDHKGLIRLSV